MLTLIIHAEICKFVFNFFALNIFQPTKQATQIKTVFKGCLLKWRGLLKWRCFRPKAFTIYIRCRDTIICVAASKVSSIFDTKISLKFRP